MMATKWGGGALVFLGLGFHNMTALELGKPIILH